MPRNLLLAGIATIALAASAPALAQQQAGPSADINQGQAPDVPAEEQQEPGTVIGNTVKDDGTERSNRVADSYDGAAGVVHATQNNGNANSINTASAVQADLATGVPAIGSGAAVNANVLNNQVDALGAEGVVDRSNEIGGSFGTFGGGLNFAGVASVIQNNGDVNEIGVATAVIAVRGTQVGDVTQNSSVAGSVINNGGFADPDTLLDSDQSRTNAIVGSFTGAAGTTTAVQNNGNANALGTATTVASHEGTNGLFTSSGSVSGNTQDNAVIDNSVNRANSIDASYDDAAGVMTAIQNNGDANTIGSAATVVVGVDPNSPLGSLGQASSATLSSNVSGNEITAVNPGATSSNLVNASYNNAAGLMQTTQNNGAGNVIGSAVAVSIQLTP